jgi:hypothetical protein
VLDNVENNVTLETLNKTQIQIIEQRKTWIQIIGQRLGSFTKKNTVSNY